MKALPIKAFAIILIFLKINVSNGPKRAIIVYAQ